MTPVVPALLSALLFASADAPRDPVGQGVWPLHPTPHVVVGFDPPDSAWGAGHRGVDLDGHAGQLVSAALAGQVLWAGRLAGRGVVVVGHGPTRTTYEPVTAHVRVGDLVSAGDVLGTLELAGSHCLPRACLHWGWLRGTTYLDPLDLVGALRIRLLPPDGSPRLGSAPVPDAWVGLDQPAQRLALRFAAGFW